MFFLLNGLYNWQNFLSRPDSYSTHSIFEGRDGGTSAGKNSFVEWKDSKTFASTMVSGHHWWFTYTFTLTQKYIISCPVVWKGRFQVYIRYIRNTQFVRDDVDELWRQHHSFVGICYMLCTTSCQEVHRNLVGSREGKSDNKGPYWHFIRLLRCRTLFLSDRPCPTESRSKVDLCPTRSCVNGSHRKVWDPSHIVGPNRRKVPGSHRYVHPVYVYSGVNGPSKRLKPPSSSVS